MKLSSPISLAIAVLVGSSRVTADHHGDNQDDKVFRLGKPEFFGSGCASPSSVQAIVTPDLQSISVKFTQFSAATSGAVTRDRKTCNLILPLLVRQGRSVGVMQVDYHGKAVVPLGPRPGPPSTAFANFQNEYFFAGVKGADVNQTWLAGTDAPIQIQNQFQVGAVAWSACGGTASFRINAAITASKPTATFADTQIMIDASGVGVSGGIRFGVTSFRCKATDKD